jgi:antirestriction protein ArdC
MHSQADYIGHWLQVLKADNRAISTVRARPPRHWSCQVELHTSVCT